MRYPVVVVVVAVACSRDKGREAEPTPGPGSEKIVEPAAPEEPTPHPAFGRLEVKVGGKPVTMSRAFIKRVSPDQWRLSISDKTGSCKELLSGVASAAPGATTLSLTLRRRITPDGGDSIVVTEAWSGGQQLAVTPASVALSGRTDKGKQVDLELAKLSANGVELEGVLTAEACGDQPTMNAGIPNEKHVSAATITVAGKKLDLASAILHGDDLVLSTGPKDCSDVTPYAQLVLERAAGQWTLSGTWLEAPVSAPAPELTATYGAQGSGKDGPTMAITLAGSSMIAPYTVALDGTLEAIDCAKPKKK